MNISTAFKVLALQVVDRVNAHFDPFDKFTRPAVLSPRGALQTLAQKEIEITTDLKEHFPLLGNKIWNYRRDAKNYPLEVGDQCLWHGIATAMWAIRYSVTSDPVDLALLRSSVVGLNLHQTAHGENVRRLIRGVWPKDLGVEEGVSNDSASGHLAGIFFAWQSGDAGIRADCNALIRGLADELMNHNYAFVDATGEPTRYGQLINGVLTDPLRASLCLAVLKLASAASGEWRYEQAYLRLRDPYGALCQFAKTSFLSMNNWEDAHRAAIHLCILADLETGHWRDVFLSGLHRTWALERKSGNAWVAYLHARHCLTSVDNSKKLLHEFELSEFHNGQKLNFDRAAELAQLGIRTFDYKGKPTASQPLPVWWVAKQDFRWQRKPYSVDDNISRIVPDCWYNGVDFLLPYWGFRQIGWLSEKE